MENERDREKEMLEKLEMSMMLMGTAYGYFKEKYDQKHDTSKLKVITFPCKPKENNLIQFKSEMLQNKEKEQEELKYRNITIKKHKTCSTWYCRYRNENGKQIYISAKTQKDCYNKLKKALANKQEPKEKQAYTFEQWKDIWLKTYKINNVRTSTLSKYKYMDKHIQSLYKLNMTRIQIIDILNILNSIEKTRSKQQVYEYLKDIFTRAYENQIIKNNIFINITKPKHEKLKEKIALTSSEEQIFVNACNKNKYGDYYLLCLYEGLRAGECLALKPNDIDINKMTLRIDESENKGNNLTKNKSSNRLVPIFNKTLRILKKYADFPKEEHIFKNTYSTYESNLRTMLKDLPIRKFSIHELRHTFITRCQEAKIALPVIQSWVGHEIGSKVTNKTYTHINNEQVIKYIDIFNKTPQN